MVAGGLRIIRGRLFSFEEVDPVCSFKYDASSKS